MIVLAGQKLTYYTGNFTAYEKKRDENVRQELLRQKSVAEEKVFIIIYIIMLLLLLLLCVWHL